MRDEDVVMTLLESIPKSYEYLMTVMKTMLMKELTMGYIMTCLMHKMERRKEKESQGVYTAMVMRQSKDNNSFLHLGAKSCFYCGKLGHIVRLSYKTKNKE